VTPPRLAAQIAANVKNTQAQALLSYVGKQEAADKRKPETNKPK
jgi:hypothetical protein